MFPVLVVAGLILLAGPVARYVGANNIRVEINSD
jgi:hypothetical protein